MTENIILDQESKKLFKSIMSDYYWDLLTVRSDFFAIGAIYEDAACGYMVAERNDLGYMIHDIFVHPDYRRKGIGTSLIHTLVGIAEEYVDDIDCHFILSKGDDSFKRFLEATKLFDFEDENDSKVFRGDVALLYESQKLKPYLDIDAEKVGCLDFYDELSPITRKEFIRECVAKEWLPVYFISAVREPQTKYCYATTSKDHKEVTAYIKVTTADETAYLDSVWFKKGHEKEMLVLFCSVINRMKADGSFKYIETCIVNQEVEDMVKKLMPDLDVISVGMSAYWNYKGLKEIA